VRQGSEYTDLFPIHSGVPQGPILYLLYTADLPTTRTTTVVTYADDTAILASHTNPTSASRNLQTNLNKIQRWLKTWRIKANETKSIYVTFTLRRETCPPVKINDCQLPQVEEKTHILQTQTAWT
jgi:hypothetical protein